MNSLMNALKTHSAITRVGCVERFFGLILEAKGPPDAFVGEICEIYDVNDTGTIEAEVMGFRDGKVLLMPYGTLHGITMGARVIATGKSARIPVAKNLLGRILDAYGEPLDSKPAVKTDDYYPIYPVPIEPMRRDRIQTILRTEIPSIDCFLTVGLGQRMGLFSGSGVGKSSLLGTIAKQVSAEINVIALIGERGREVREFVEDILGEEGLKKSVVIAACADRPALERVRAAYAATALAEFYRDQGKHVVLMMDSITRFAMALREIGLALGEPPTARGYTPSVFTQLPQILERGGCLKNSGSITAFYTVLVEGDDFNEPISDHVRAILDGHLMLTRDLAQEGKYPPIDLLKSISRLFPRLVNHEEQKLIGLAIEHLSVYQRYKEMIDMGAYQKGNNQRVDCALTVVPKLEQFLYHKGMRCSRDRALQEIRSICETLEKNA